MIQVQGYGNSCHDDPFSQDIANQWIGCQLSFMMIDYTINGAI